MTRIALTLVAAGFFVIPAHAGVVLCAKPRGDGSFSTTVKIRTGACRATEQQLDPGPLGLQGPPGDAGSGAAVKDADGALVGVSTHRGVVRDVGGGRLVALAVTPSGFTPMGTVESEWLYSAADCTGQAFVQHSEQAVQADFVESPAAVIGSTLYLGNPSPGVLMDFLAIAKPGWQQAACEAWRPGGCGGKTHFIPPDRCCIASIFADCSPASFSYPAVPKESMFDDIIDLSALVPPFHMELR